MIGRLLTALTVVVVVDVACKQAPSGPVTEISHSRTMCFGSCPVYSIVLRADGTALFNGQANVTPLGPNRGVIGREAFERLVALAEEARFFGLESSYREEITDLPTRHTIVIKGNRRKEVQAYGTAPAGLVRLEDAIDALRREIAWTAADTKP